MSDEIGKPKVYEIIVQNIRYNKDGPKVTSRNVIKKPGWQEWMDEYEDR